MAGNRECLLFDRVKAPGWCNGDVRDLEELCRHSSQGCLTKTTTATREAKKQTLARPTLG